jgi:hypothetical protein
MEMSGVKVFGKKMYDELISINKAVKKQIPMYYKREEKVFSIVP